MYEGEAGVGDTQGWTKEDGETFAEKWLWNRQSVDQLRPLSNGNGSIDREVSITGEEENQFTIADEEEEDEEAGEGELGGLNEGAKAFKAAVGRPPRVNGNSVAEEEERKEIPDPLSRATPETEVEEQVDHRREEDTIPCLIDRLFSCTIDLLFCAGFTVPESVRGKDGTGEKINVRCSIRITRL